MLRFIVFSLLIFSLAVDLPVLVLRTDISPEALAALANLQKYLLTMTVISYGVVGVIQDQVT